MMHHTTTVEVLLKAVLHHHHYAGLVLLSSSSADLWLAASDGISQRSLSCPNIHPNLAAHDDRLSSVQSPHVASTIFTQILPEYGAPLDGSENGALVAFGVAVYPATPRALARRLEQGKRSAASDCTFADRDVGEEARGPIAALRSRSLRWRREPVGVEVIMAAGAIADELQGLKACSSGSVETLEGKGTLVEAVDKL